MAILLSEKITSNALISSIGASFRSFSNDDNNEDKNFGKKKLKIKISKQLSTWTFDSFLCCHIVMKQQVVDTRLGPKQVPTHFSFSF